MTTELLIAMALLTGLLLPLAFSFAGERRLARATYERAIALEIVDGEMEVLLAGERLAFPPGRHPYQVRSAAVTNLSSGQFWLTLSTNRMRLEWAPASSAHRQPVVREVTLP